MSKMKTKAVRLAHTTALGEFLKNAQSRGDHETVQYVVEKVIENANVLRKMTPGANRARVVHRKIEEEKAKVAEEKPERAKKISCRNGCAFCCHIQVHVTPDEADLMAERVRGGLEIDMAKLKEMTTLPEDNDEFWIRQPIPLKKCIFLGDDNLCSVYDDRPAVCRNYEVTSPPEKCDTENLHDDGVYCEIIPLAEMMASSAMEAAGVLRALPNALYEKLISEEKK